MSKLEIVREESEPCRFCQRKTLDEYKYGHMYKIQGITVHYYCVLFSQRIEQNGTDDEGLLGFLFEDIMNELNKVKNSRCAFCLQRNASIHCAISKCKLIFHYPCGLQRGSLHQFKDHYKSYCFTHRPKQRIPAAVLAEAEKNAPVCSICFDSIDYKNLIDSIWAPCCIKTWYHRLCLQKFSMSSGYFFRCAICNQKGIFLKWVKTHGIHVPDQDASWEMEINAFRDLEYRHNKCDAVHCKNPDRTVNVKDTPWELVLCNSCASEGVHMICANLKCPDSQWECRSCKSVRPFHNENKLPTRRRNRKKISEEHQEVSYTEKNLDKRIYGESSNKKGKKRKSENTDEIDKTSIKKMKNVEGIQQRSIRKSVACSKEIEKANATVISSESCNSQSELKMDNLEEQNKNIEVDQESQSFRESPQEGVSVFETENLSSANNANLSTQENVDEENPVTSSSKDDIDASATSVEVPEKDDAKNLEIEKEYVVVNDESSDSDVELLYEQKKERLPVRKFPGTCKCGGTLVKAVANTNFSQLRNDDFEVIILHYERKKKEETCTSNITELTRNNAGLSKSFMNSTISPRTGMYESRLTQNIENNCLTKSPAASSCFVGQNTQKQNDELIDLDKNDQSNYSSSVGPDSSTIQQSQLMLTTSDIKNDEYVNPPCSSESLFKSSIKQTYYRRNKNNSNMDSETVQRDMNILNQELQTLFEHYCEKPRAEIKYETKRKSSQKAVSSPCATFSTVSHNEEKGESVEPTKMNKSEDDGNIKLLKITKKLDVAGSETNSFVTDEIIEID